MFETYETGQNRFLGLVIVSHNFYRNAPPYEAQGSDLRYFYTDATKTYDVLLNVSPVAVARYSGMYLPPHGIQGIFSDPQGCPSHTNQ